MTNHSISVFGLGYVGLSTAVCFASRGLRVLGVDVDEEKVRQVSEGKSPVYEPGLQELLSESIEKGLLACTLQPRRAVIESDISFITVGTPSRPNGSIDVSGIEQACRQIGQALKDKQGWHLVVVRSTVAPGTTDQVVKATVDNASLKKCGVDWGLCMNPEFLREGSAIRDTLNPDRIVIGQHDEMSGKQLENLYRRFYGEKVPPILRMSLSNAELTKYANNAFLAMKVSFINMIANLCQKIPGADVTEVAKAIGQDRRICPHFLDAGLGYGGSCFPKDLKAMLSFAKKIGVSVPLVDATISLNERQPLEAVEMTEHVIGGLRGKKVAVLGLSFKPNTDDVREAVSVRLIRGLLDMGARVVAYDPVAMDNARKVLGDKILYAPSALECIDEADSCIVVTEWEEFKKLQPQDFLERMRTPLVIDGRRIFDPKDFGRKVRFAAIGLGATSTSPSER